MRGSGEWGRLLRRSTTVSLLAALGVAAGFLLDVLIVARYGMGTETDAFFGAYTIPLILITCLASLQPVLVTVLTDTTRDNLVFSVLLNASGLSGLALVTVGGLAARWLVAVATPGFDRTSADLSVVLARILFARVPAAALSEVCKAELYARRRFAIPTFSNAAPSLVTVALLLASPASVGIQMVAWGFVAGAWLQVALLVTVLLTQRVPYYLLAIEHRHILRRLSRMILTPLAGLLLRQSVTLAERLIGSFLPAGSVTALSYANRLTMTIAGVFFDGFATASLPSLAECWSRGPAGASRAELSRLLRLSAYVAMPLGLGLAALSAPLVQLLFERGQMDHQAALLLGTVFGVYSLSLPFLGPFRAVQTFYYAVKEMRPIVFLMAGLAALTVILDLVLVWTLDAVGLALAFVLSCGMITALGLFWLARRVREPAGTLPQGLNWRQIVGSWWRLGLASAAMAMAMLAVSHWLPVSISAGGRGGLLLVLGLSSLAGLAVFAAAGAMLRVEPVLRLWSLFKRRWTTTVGTNS